jgi:hypothetical protein
MLFIIRLIPLKMQKIAVAQSKMPNPKIKGYKLCSWFLNELFITTGPINNRGKAPDKNWIPFNNIFLLVGIKK